MGKLICIMRTYLTRGTPSIKQLQKTNKTTTATHSHITSWRTHRTLKSVRARAHSACPNPQRAVERPVRFRALSFQNCSLSLSHTHTHTGARAHTLFCGGTRACRSVILSASPGLFAHTLSPRQVSESPQISPNSPQQQLQITDRLQRRVCVCVC